MAPEYNPLAIEPKWQKRWTEDKLYQVTEDPSRPEWYALTMFPYTSGDLHIGHWYAMAPSDVHARFKRMQGFNVLHPMGFDAFGLPAENAAIKHGIHPYTWTMKNVENMRRQLKTIGAIYDWDREVITCLPDYYRWTQWFFLKLYEAGLAYRAKAPVNWCPKCQVVLANEQVIDGGCWRCETQVIRRALNQWFFKITRYADELMKHEGLDWPERIKTMQKNWVGRSEGAEICFDIDGNTGQQETIKVFTTRPDTVYGITYVVLAPEHPLVEKITAPDRLNEVNAYIESSRKRTEIERLSTEKEKDGVFTGAYAINHVNGERVPIWIGDYVLLSYGTGIVMGVPAHDQRDFTFAKKYGLPIKTVITPPDWRGEELSEAYIDDGIMVDSGPFSGMPSSEGRSKVTEYLSDKGWGNFSVSYKLRDWLVSRQRYWGAPIPMVYCQNCGIVPVAENELPVLLPTDIEFSHSGESPLKNHQDFLKTTCPQCKGTATRETDTMDTFMCSSWYFLRYTSPGFEQGAFDKEKLKYWMPVDLYTGGAEHAVMHLFYSRFFTKALRDMGLVDFDEPFTKLFNQGTIIVDRQKMSKSRGNVINPDHYVSTLGADVVRTYLMFVAPWEQGGEWNDSGISGINRWLNRVWNLSLEEYRPSGETDSSALKEFEKNLHQTVRKVTQDIDSIHFNTMISAMMEFTNFLTRVKETGLVSRKDWDEAIRCLLLMLAPSAPHITEELWQLKGYPYSIHNQPWPKWDEAKTREEELTIAIQVNGKLKGKINVPATASKEDVLKKAMEENRVFSYLKEKTVVSTIYVPGRIVNLVVK
ncbi:MAG: leucine--tRNA ligase [Dehalococcoidales bacterium]|nr:leucine--tRNA ligase [Dehalococcoidales bacterium]MDD4465468.1 leucine--tRNA ligase [Dehalococcoidales bacterium]MDD5402015.1 leucine--tRNA ligase [Dehalococcoidales bacterium]